MGIHPQALQRAQHAGPAHQRHRTLGAVAAIQHGHLAERTRVDVEIDRRGVHAEAPCEKYWATSRGSALIEPAPMPITMSPSRVRAASAAGMSATLATKFGVPTALASAAPVAPSMRASPAAYTSVSSTTSAAPITRTKSAKQSRVRV
mmetsp:Transcript_6955/g.29364  ORF Transcript_6955/g.29364 Transcript_6955/m.29364 type:complete len:148 (-) Transcript_6955:1907-2350(-)